MWFLEQSIKTQQTKKSSAVVGCDCWWTDLHDLCSFKVSFTLSSCSLTSCLTITESHLEMKAMGQIKKGLSLSAFECCWKTQQNINIFSWKLKKIQLVFFKTFQRTSVACCVFSHAKAYLTWHVSVCSPMIVLFIASVISILTRT